MLGDLDLGVNALIHVADYLLVNYQIASFLNMFTVSSISIGE